MKTLLSHLDIGLIISVIGLVFRLAVERGSLPSPVAKLLSRIGFDRIADWIGEAADFADMAPDEKREWVIKKAVGYCATQGITHSEGFIRIVVEYVFQKTEKARL